MRESQSHIQIGFMEVHRKSSQINSAVHQQYVFEFKLKTLNYQKSTKQVVVFPQMTL